MKKISNYTGILESDTEHVLSLLQKWKPSAPGLSEKAYEQELLAWLMEKLPDVPMMAQYGIAKGKADIVIEDKHVIELKLAFTDDVAEFDRCIGQLVRYKQAWVSRGSGPVYLVVVGKSDVSFREWLHRWFEETNGVAFQMLIDTRTFFLVEKH